MEVEQFLPLAGKIATAVWRRGGQSLDLDDLRGEAALIVVRAVNSHDPARGDLHKHVRSRLNYDLLSYVRELNPLSRAHQEQVKAGEASPVRHVPLVVGDGEGGEVERPIVGEDDSIDELVRSDHSAKLLAAAKLNTQERGVLRRVRAGSTLASIAGQLRLSPGRISQVLTQIKVKVQQATAEQPAVCLECEIKLQPISHNVRQKWFCSRQCSDKYGRFEKRKIRDEDQLLFLYVRKKLSIAKIAVILKAGRGAVYGALRRLGVTMRKASVVPKVTCIEEGCGKPVVKVFSKKTRRWHGVRCRFHRNLFNARIEKGYRILHHLSSEELSERAKKVWQTRRERYGACGSRIAGSSVTPERRSEFTKRGWVTRKKNVLIRKGVK